MPHITIHPTGGQIAPSIALLPFSALNQPKSARMNLLSSWKGVFPQKACTKNGIEQERQVFRSTPLQLAVLFSIAAIATQSPAQDLASFRDPQRQFIDAPPGFQAACRRYDWVCANWSESRAAPPENEVLRIGAAVNRDVNGEIEQVSDREIYGAAERWTLPVGGRGDCEDLVLEKMYRLLRNNVPARRLSIAIALDKRGDNHAVLLLRTKDDHLVLDSLTDRLLRPSETGYRMLAMQASEDRSRWEVADRTSIAGRSTAESMQPSGAPGEISLFSTGSLGSEKRNPGSEK